jgi:hypothetical protein
MTGNSSMEPRMNKEYTEEYLLQRAREEVVADRTKDWEITNLKAEEQIPKFHSDGTSIFGLFHPYNHTKRVATIRGSQ